MDEAVSDGVAMNDRSAESDFRFAAGDGYSLAATLRRPEIGRASCRERV